MKVVWKKKNRRFNPAVILSRIEESRTVSPDGSVAFNGFEWADLAPVLESMLEFTDAPHGLTMGMLVDKGLSGCLTPLTPETFLSAVNSALQSKASGPPRIFHVLTSVSIDRMSVPQSLSVGGVTIRFLKGDYPHRYKDRAAVLSRRFPASVPTPADYTKLIGYVKASSPEAAFHIASQAFETARAIWCMASNPSAQFFFGTPPRSPINVVRAGEFHTVHEIDGAMATQTVWYQTQYQSTKVYRSDDPKLRVKFCRRNLARVAKSAYSDKLVAALTRYAAAFDEPDPNVAFIRLWSAMEMLTSPGAADHQKLVNRCASMFLEGAFHTQILEHLREYRNASVHAAEYTESARTLCYHLQRYFISLMGFHIHNAGVFGTLDEANIFLDAPREIETLKRQLFLVKKAIRYRGYVPASA